MTKNELNEFYRAAEFKTVAIIGKLEIEGLKYDVGFYNGHYGKNEQGEYEKEYFPIPVVSVEGLCDIEIGYDLVTVTSKLQKDNALSFNYYVIGDYKFQVYSVNDFLFDFKTENDTVDKLLANIKSTSDGEIGFQFSFDNADAKQIVSLVKILQSNGFYY